MNKIVVSAIVAAVCLTSIAEDIDDAKIIQAVENATGWTAQELVDALYLMNAKYNRDMRTEAGRKEWFGKLDHTIVNTNDLTRTEVYEEGFTYTVPWNKPNPAAEVKAANAKLKMPNLTNGVPVRLAAARLRREAEKTTVSNVTVNITANAPKGAE